MARARAALALLVVVAAAGLAVSGASRADPRTPRGIPGMPTPFLGTAVVGDGGRTAAVDAYGDVVGVWQPGPVGHAVVNVPATRQAAGTVPRSDAILAWMRLEGGRSAPLWRADSVRQRYLPGTNVLLTLARAGEAHVRVIRRIGRRAAARADRRWVSRARPLGAAAPAWARRMYVRSLLVLRALTDRRSGAVAAGARDGSDYVWPRDASAVAIALASAGYRAEARRVVRFLLRLDLGAAARFQGTGAAVGGRAAQGDAAGWVAVAARAAGLGPAARSASRPVRDSSWRDLADYQEGNPGNYLGNAIASTATSPADGPKSHVYRGFSARRRDGEEIRREFGTPAGTLARRAHDPGSGLDSAAAWAVRPFRLRSLFPLARRTMLRLAARAGRFGITPSRNWPGRDPWTAPTAWTAWSLAALGERRMALRLLGDLRRAATPTGMLPERVDVRTGIPRSTTPLAWSHAFAILALRQLWPEPAPRPPR